MEAERLAVMKAQDQWKREKLALIKRLDMMEAEKRRTDAVIRETALQREAIEKSLNAMERENRELYKNCSMLQQQIAQLELENGNRVVEMSNRQKEDQEKHLQRIRAEKSQVIYVIQQAPCKQTVQIEKMIADRERTYRQRIKQLENQIQVLRDQLDSERRRGRDYRDRQIAGDIGRVGGANYFGLNRLGGGGFSSLGAYAPGNIDGERWLVTLCNCTGLFISECAQLSPRTH